MNKYRHQRQATVFYNPARPQEAFLEPANIGDITMPLVWGGLLVFLWFIAFFDQSVGVNTPGRDQHLHWGNIYQQQGKLEEALDQYNKLIDISPHLAVGYASRGSVHLQQGKWAPAIADFNKSLTIDPMAAMIYFNRANAYLGNKQYDKALADMQKAMGMGFKVNPEILERIKKASDLQ